MTITVPLSPEEEAKLIALAEGRGVSPDQFLRCVVKDILDAGHPGAGGEVPPEEREKRLEELFAALDSVSTPAGVREEAFHRENWYR